LRPRAIRAPSITYSHRNRTVVATAKAEVVGTREAAAVTVARRDGTTRARAETRVGTMKTRVVETRAGATSRARARAGAHQAEASPDGTTPDRTTRAGARVVARTAAVAVRRVGTIRARAGTRVVGITRIRAGKKNNTKIDQLFLACQRS